MKGMRVIKISFKTRLEHALPIHQPVLDEFRRGIRLKWYDVEFYTAVITDLSLVVLDALLIKYLPVAEPCPHNKQ